MADKNAGGIFIPAKISHILYISFSIKKFMIDCVRITYNFDVMNTKSSSKKKSWISISLNNLAVCKPVLARKQELRGHVQAILRADIIALGAEDALGDIDANTFC